MNNKSFELIDTPDEFSLKINGTEIKRVQEYEIKRNPFDVLDIALKITVPYKETKIAIKRNTPVAGTTDVMPNILLDGKPIF